MAKKQDETKVKEIFQKNCPEPATREEMRRAKNFLKEHGGPVKRRKKGTFSRLVLTCLRFGTAPAWCCQGAIAFLFYWFMKKNGAGELKGVITRHLPFLLTGFGLFLAMAAIPWIYRSVRYKMLEVECAAYFSIGHLLFARIVVSGVGGVAALAAVSGWMALSGWHLSLQSIFFGVFAFLFCTCLLAWLISKGMFSRIIPVCTGGCAVFLMTVKILDSIESPLLFYPWQTGCICCLLLFALLCGQMKQVLSVQYC